MKKSDASAIDVFLSYADLDDRSVRPGQAGWVSILRKALDIRLSQRVGESVRIFMDRDVRLQQPLGPAVEEALRNSRTLLTVVSPAYLRSEQCLRERRYYLQAVGHDLPDFPQWSRIFKVIKDPVPFAELPDPLDNVIGYEFFRTDPATGQIRSSEPEGNQDHFWTLIEDLAYDIWKALTVIREGRVPEESWIPSLHGGDPEENRVPSRAEARMSSTTGGDHPLLEIIERDGSSRALRAFLCHSSADKPGVRDLFRRLAQDGCDVWLDEEKLLPGQKWADEIPRAVRNSDVVVVCVSRGATAKRGYLQKEITFALDIAAEEPEGSIFLIPARLEECEIPDRLREYHWVNLYEQSGYAKLLTSLRAKATRLNIESAGSE